MRYTSVDHRNPEDIIVDDRKTSADLPQLRFMMEENDSVEIAKGVFVTVLSVGSHRCEIMFEAPREIPIKITRARPKKR